MSSPFQGFEKGLRAVEEKAKAFFPITSRLGKVMRASNFRWDDWGQSMADNITEQKDAKVKEKTFATNLRADIEMLDEDGKVMDSKTNYLVLKLPHLTARNSFIVNGTEVQVVNQLRWRPGIYTRIDPQGLVETTLNTSAAGSYKVLLDRKSGLLRFKVGTDKKVPIYSVLRMLQANDVQIRRLLGDLYDANVRISDLDSDTDKMYGTLRYAKPGLSQDDKWKELTSFMESKPLDPGSTKLTTGNEFEKISLQAMEAAVRKCMDVGRGEAEQDDIESLAFKTVHSYEDFIPERLTKALPALTRRVAREMDQKESLTAAFLPGLLGDSIQTFLTTSEMTHYSEQNNPLDIAAKATMITLMGEGGIQNEHAITDDVRMVHPSQYGLIDTVHLPEGQKVGVTTHFSLGAKKVGNKIHLTMFDAKTGKESDLPVEESMPLTIAFADQYENIGSGIPKLHAGITEVKARRGSKIIKVKPSEVQYIFNKPESFFSFSTNSIPFLNNNSANRLLMADKHLEQSVQLKENEIPLVQPKLTGKQAASYHETFGTALLVRAPADGTVGRITAGSIRIKTAAGMVTVHIHDHYPLNSDTFMHDTPIVKTGDKVKKGQPLVENNFTKDKTLALGRSLNYAFVAYKGENFEDGVVISETAAKKLTSVHKYEYKVEKEGGTKIGLADFLAHFPNELEVVGDRSRYDSDGVIKEGTVVQPDDLLIPAVKTMDMRATDIAQVHKKLLSTKDKNVSAIWDHSVSGTVINVVKTGKFTKVFIKAEEPVVIGDKLSSAAASKGIITNIIPDHEMYKDGSGNTLDVLFNGYGVTGRINPGLLFEAAAGKIAQKTGKTYYTSNFGQTEDGTLKQIQADLAKAGISDAETLSDPMTGNKIENVLVGPIHTLKLKHSVAKKISSRGAIGGMYTALQQPKKVHGESAQRIGALDTYSLLSGGATEFLKDAFGVKAQKNDEYWIALQTGRTLPAPESPYVTEKLVAEMIASGININQEGSNLLTSPMTDDEIDKLSTGKIENYNVVRSSDLREQPGGLFDPQATGGHGGASWASIDLPEPTVNALLKPALLSVAEITSVELADILKGVKAVQQDGTIGDVADGGLVGGDGLKRLLASKDVNKEIKVQEGRLATVRKSGLNKAYKRMRYLQSLKKMKLKPENAYLNTKLIVIPPKYRPVSESADGNLSVADANHAYREVMIISEQLKDLKEMGVANEHLGDLRVALDQSVGALAGLNSFVTKGRQFRGFLEAINGAGSSKYGYFKSKVFRREQDLSARSTVIPNPKLHMDYVGVPKSMAFTIYQPFIVKRMVQNGYTPEQAKEQVTNKSPEALRMLEQEMNERPVLMNRAPSLHKFSVVAQKPVLTDGKAIEVNPLIINGMNMDFDGDTVGLHVPVSENARKEALTKLMPSGNLIAIQKDEVIHAPVKETVLGLYLMTTPKGDAKISVQDPRALTLMYAEGKIKANTAAKVGNVVHCYGQYRFDALIPADQKLGPIQITSKVLDGLLLTLARELSAKQASDIISAIKDLGNHYVTEIGHGISLKDLEFDYKKRDAILDRAERRRGAIGFEAAAMEAKDGLRDMLALAVDNRFVEQTILSGSTGKAGQVQQMIATPVAVQDHKGKAIPFFLRKSYAEGHDLGDFLSGVPGSRKGLIDKGLSVAKTGYLNRVMANAGIENKITTKDCGTTNGIDLKIDDTDLVGRYGAGAFQNVLMDRAKVTSLRNTKRTMVKVRSPLTCQVSNGICSMCYGLLETGNPPRVGYHVGVMAAQTLGERSTQTILQSFHTGSALGAGASVGFNRINELVHLTRHMKGQAILASSSGIVTNITVAPAGGWHVSVGSTKHFIPKEMGLGVKERQSISAGDMLSAEGTINPRNLLEATGDIRGVQNTMVSELQASFGGQKIRRKLFETVLKPMTDRAKITDSGDGLLRFGVHIGDVVSTSKIEEYNKQLAKKIKFEPILIGTNQLPQYNDDFVNTLVHERLRDTLRSAPTHGRSIDMKSGGTISQLVFRNMKHIDQIKNR